MAKDKFFRRIAQIPLRAFSSRSNDQKLPKNGLILGVYNGCIPGEFKFTDAACKFDNLVDRRLSELLRASRIKQGCVRIFNNLGDYYAVAAVGLGPEGVGYCEIEELNETKENVRIAAGIGAKALQDAGVSQICIEGMGDTEAGAEGASLATWIYDQYKNAINRSLPKCCVNLYEDPDRDGFARGMLKAGSQNIARELEEAPANEMTAIKLSQKAIEILCPCDVNVDVRDKDWLQQKGFCSFLQASKSSSSSPLLVELSYCGGASDDKPVILVGKGVTFDSGGISLKKCKQTQEHKADMAGAAVVIGVMKTIAALGLPINVNALLPLTENMPGGMAVKPGDIVLSMAGKTVRIQDTAHQGRVIVADALSYTCNYKPCLVINIGTFSAGTKSVFGDLASAVFTTSETVFCELKKAGSETGDRVWRLPLWKRSHQKLTESPAYDINNIEERYQEDPFSAAAFAYEFVPPVDFLSIDIAGTSRTSRGLGYPYLREGFMTGRPTRTLSQFLVQMACPTAPVF